MIARGEAEEVRSHLSVARGLNYINKEDFDKLEYEYNGLGIDINAYINELDKQALYVKSTKESMSQPLP